MYRNDTRISPDFSDQLMPTHSAGQNVNAIDEVDQFVTAEPTPKMESRRGWRRRRVRRGKS